MSKKISLPIIFLFLVSVISFPLYHLNAADDEAVLYFFWGVGCPFCDQQEEFLEELEDKYPGLEIKDYEVYQDPEGREFFMEMARLHNLDREAVPATFIGEQHWVGFRNTMKTPMEEAVAECIETGCPDAAELDSAATEQVDVEDLRPYASQFQSVPDLEPLIEHLAEGRLALLGEASHGTEEYYHWRAGISRKLIEEHDFDFVVVEGDWGSLYEVNKYVNQDPEALADKETVLAQLDRWPPWMWANPVVEEFIGWLRDYNAGGNNVGFYGLDVYGAWQDGDRLLELIGDPELRQRAEEKFECFEDYRDDGQAYAQNYQQFSRSCAEEMGGIYRLVDEEIAPGVSPERALRLRQKASVLKQSERHYRAMATAELDGWNERVAHMESTLERLLNYYGEDARGIVWAHNTHVGDARATVMAQQGRDNIGQLTRVNYGADKVRILGQSGYQGSVRAGSAWGQPGNEMELPAAQENSHEALLNELGKEQYYLIFDDQFRQTGLLEQNRGHRAVGVVYNPRQERGNYVPTLLPVRYDALLFFRETTALDPHPAVE